MNKHDIQNKITTILTLDDNDVYLDTPPIDYINIKWKDRRTGKIVLVNSNNQIALIGNKVNDFFLLPGGGIEDTESIIDGIHRECLEETGCSITVDAELGIAQDFRVKECKHCITYGYLARPVIFSNPTLTASEIDIGAYIKWVTLSEANSIFTEQEEKVRRGEVKFYNTSFNIMRDALFIRIATEKLKSVPPLSSE